MQLGVLGNGRLNLSPHSSQDLCVEAGLPQDSKPQEEGRKSPGVPQDREGRASVHAPHLTASPHPPKPPSPWPSYCSAAEQSLQVSGEGTPGSPPVERLRYFQSSLMEALTYRKAGFKSHQIRRIPLGSVS